jgi:uncharacterized membrane protein
MSSLTVGRRGSLFFVAVVAVNLALAAVISRSASATTDDESCAGSGGDNCYCVNAGTSGAFCGPGPDTGSPPCPKGNKDCRSEQ